MESLTTRTDYLKATQQQDGIAILEATASWCGQCKAIAPKVQELVKQYPQARFYSYDVDTAPDIAQELGVRSMPTFTFFKDGEVETSLTGANPAALENACQKVCEA